MSSTQNPDPERDLMEGTSKQHNEMTDQAKRYPYMSTDNQLHPTHPSSVNISSCGNTGGYTDTLTYKKVYNETEQLPRCNNTSRQCDLFAGRKLR